MIKRSWLQKMITIKRSYFLQFLVGWQICHLQSHLQYGSCNLHILVAIKKWESWGWWECCWRKRCCDVIVVKNMSWNIHWSAIYILKLWLRLAYLIWVLCNCIILLVIVKRLFFMFFKFFHVLVEVVCCLFIFNIYEFADSDWLDKIFHAEW